MTSRLVPSLERVKQRIRKVLPDSVPRLVEAEVQLSGELTCRKMSCTFVGLPRFVLGEEYELDDEFYEDDLELEIHQDWSTGEIVTTLVFTWPGRLSKLDSEPELR